ncbi:MAG: MlaC/ttg2D family ABC transporter substrate-binding protein [Stellaceae bacterium]
MKSGFRTYRSWLAILALLAPPALVAPSRPAAALPASGGDTVREFYAVLLGTMKNARSLGESGRYARLAPVIRQTFDLPLMTQMAVGPAWSSLSADQRQQLIRAFGRYMSAVYADRFDHYAGEQLRVISERPAASGLVVNSEIVRADGTPVSIDYLMRRHGGSWQIADVYLNGTISTLATHRSEFAGILEKSGVLGLIAALNRKADRIAAPGPGNPS